MWLQSYDHFSTGMRDDRVITLIDWHWQEAPLGYYGP